MKKFILLGVLALGPSLASAQEISREHAHLALEALGNALSVQGSSSRATGIQRQLQKFREVDGRITGVRVTTGQGEDVTVSTVRFTVTEKREVVAAGHLNVVIENGIIHSAEYRPQAKGRGVRDRSPGPSGDTYPLADVLGALNALEGVLRTDQSAVDTFQSESNRITKLKVGRGGGRGGATVTYALTVGTNIANRNYFASRGVFTIAASPGLSGEPFYSTSWKAAKSKSTGRRSGGGGAGQDCGLL